MKELILGGARSGKSHFALTRAEQSGLSLHYVATAQAGDDEMRFRIAAHRAARGARWQVVEESQELANVLLSVSHDDSVIVVDCLTLWITNCLLAQTWAAQKRALLNVFDGLKGHLIFISNETGMGIIPMGDLSRRFIDESGFFHQELAARCARVTLMVAGIPLVTKPIPAGNIP